VAAAAHRHLGAGGAGHADSVDDVGNATAGRDRRGALVDQCVVHSAALFVGVVAGTEQVSSKRRGGECEGFSYS